MKLSEVKGYKEAFSKVIGEEVVKNLHKKDNEIKNKKLNQNESDRKKNEN